MLKPYIEKLIRRENLTSKESKKAMSIIINGANQAQIVAFLVLLRAKQETADEIFGIVNAMRKTMITVHVKNPVMDIVGTGGDGKNTANISTGASLLAASCGVRIVKHGNRSVSSRCGSADVLEMLGLNINQDEKKVAESVKKNNFGFCFAPKFHPALSQLKEIRTSLKIPTCFNILGPLLNPAHAEFLMIGVFDSTLLDLIADVLLKLKVTRALIFHGNGLDEISCIGQANAIEIFLGKKKHLIIDPKEYGFKQCDIDDLKGGTPKENARQIRNVFDGIQGPIADTIILNAAIALNIYGKSKSINNAVQIVKKNIQDRTAKHFLERICK